jgi:hypothetical protein
LAILGRTATQTLDPLRDTGPPQLPQHLSGQWWADELSVLVVAGALQSDELRTLQPDDPCTQRELLTWTLRLARAGGVSGLPETDPGDEALAEAALAHGMALAEGDYGISLDASATRGHAAVAAAALFELLGRHEEE